MYSRTTVGVSGISLSICGSIFLICGGFDFHSVCCASPPYPPRHPHQSPLLNSTTFHTPSTSARTCARIHYPPPRHPVHLQTACRSPKRVGGHNQRPPRSRRHRALPLLPSLLLPLPLVSLRTARGVFQHPKVFARGPKLVNFSHKTILELALQFYSSTVLQLYSWLYSMPSWPSTPIAPHPWRPHLHRPFLPATHATAAGSATTATAQASPTATSPRPLGHRTSPPSSSRRGPAAPVGPGPDGAGLLSWVLGPHM
jgi:hypothetical protein